jgi:hypothetical protein
MAFLNICKFKEPEEPDVKCLRDVPKGETMCDMHTIESLRAALLASEARVGELEGDFKRSQDRGDEWRSRTAEKDAQIKRLTDQLGRAEKILHSIHGSEHWEECDFFLEEDDSACNCCFGELETYFAAKQGKGEGNV